MKNSPNTIIRALMMLALCFQIMPTKLNAQWTGPVSGTMRTPNNVAIGTNSPTGNGTLEVRSTGHLGIYVKGNTQNFAPSVVSPLILEANIDYRGRGMFMTHRDTSDTTASAWFAGVPYKGRGFQIGNSTEHSSFGINNPALRENAKFFINPLGRVGIGTITPSDKLHVTGNLYLNGEHDNDEIRFESQEGFHRIAFRQLRFWDWDAGQDNMTINNGLVGIGTTDPQYKLDVNGSIKGTYMYVQAHSAPKNWQIYYNANTERDFGLRFLNQHREPILVLNNQTGSAGNSYFPTGGLGIATANIPAGFKLAVDGKVICEELQVKLSENWPDYVFGDNYQLMSLKDLGAHIDQKKHLPGIPKASELEENGIAVGEMQRLMMEKIEELTLYLLQQNEKIEAQQQKIIELESRLSK